MTILNRQASFKNRLQRQLERKQEDMGTDPEEQINGEEGHKSPDDDEATTGGQPAGDAEQELMGLTADPGELPPPSPTPLSAENYETANGFYPPYRDDGGIAPKRYSEYYRDEPDLDKHVEKFYDEDYAPKDRDHLLDPLEMDAIRKKKRSRFSRRDGGVFWTVPWIAFCVFVAVLLGISVHYGTKGSPRAPEEEGSFDYGAITSAPEEGDTEVTTTVDGNTEVIATVGNDGNVTNVTIVTHPAQPVTFMPTIAPSKMTASPSDPSEGSVPPASSPETSPPAADSTEQTPTASPTAAPTSGSTAASSGIPTIAPIVATSIPPTTGPTVESPGSTNPPTHDPFAPPTKLTFPPTAMPTQPTAQPTEDAKHHNGDAYDRDWWAADKAECGQSESTINYEQAYFHYLYANDVKLDNGFDLQCCSPCYWLYQEQCMCPAAFLEVPRQDDAEDQWQLTHQRNLAELTRSMESGEPLDLIMYGDSITEHLQGTDWTRPAPNLQPSRTLFESMFEDEGAPYKGLALGIGGDVSTWLLWRLQHGEFPIGKLAPRVVWLNIGTNEFPMLCNPERIFLGIVAVVQLIHDLSPSTAIIVNSILPRCTGGDKVGSLFPDNNPNGVGGWSTQTDWINEQLDCWISEIEGVHFLNNNHALLTEDRQRIELSHMLNGEDCLHPNEDGYSIILKTIQDLLHDILN